MSLVAHTFGIRRHVLPPVDRADIEFGEQELDAFHGRCWEWGQIRQRLDKYETRLRQLRHLRHLYPGRVW
jgi:hypothetical protein